MDKLSLLLVLLLGLSIATCQLQLWNIQAHDNDRSADTVPGYYDDWVIFSRVNNDPSLPWMENDLELIQRNISTLTIKNSGTSTITVSALTIADANMFAVLQESLSALPKAIAGGADWEIKMQFIHSGGPPTHKLSTLHIVSNDAERPQIDVGLGGVYQPQPEGPSEAPLASVVAASGWLTILNEFAPTEFLDWPHLSENITDGPRGDEFRAQFWQAADPSKPVMIRQAGAWQHCCTGAPVFELKSQASGSSLLKVASQNPLYGQTILPANKADATKFNEGKQIITEPFVVIIDGYRSDAPRYLGLHFYAVRGRDGQIVPNTYLIPMDYVTPYYKGCLDPYTYPGHANCDFQDNVFYFTNVKPSGDLQTAAPSPGTSVTVAATTGTDPTGTITGEVVTSTSTTADAATSSTTSVVSSATIGSSTDAEVATTGSSTAADAAATGSSTVAEAATSGSSTIAEAVTTIATTVSANTGNFGLASDSAVAPLVGSLAAVIVGAALLLTM